MRPKLERGVVRPTLVEGSRVAGRGVVSTDKASLEVEGEMRRESGVGRKWEEEHQEPEERFPFHRTNSQTRQTSQERETPLSTRENDSLVDAPLTLEAHRPGTPLAFLSKDRPEDPPTCFDENTAKETSLLSFLLYLEDEQTKSTIQQPYRVRDQPPLMGQMQHGSKDTRT